MNEEPSDDQSKYAPPSADGSNVLVDWGTWGKKSGCDSGNALECGKKAEKGGRFEHHAWNSELKM